MKDPVVEIEAAAAAGENTVSRSKQPRLSCRGNEGSKAEEERSCPPMDEKPY